MTEFVLDKLRTIQEFRHLYGEKTVQDLIRGWLQAWEQDKVERDAAVQAIKAARIAAKSKGMTTREFASMCGVTPTQLSEWTADEIDREPDIVCNK